MPSDDRDLVRRCLAGDRSAFDILYDRHAPRVFRMLRRLARDEAEAEDLTQETLLAAYRDLGAWRGEGAFTTWLCGIAFHQYTNARRRRGHAEAEQLDEEAGLSMPDADPLAHCLRQERRERIEDAIGALPPIYREVFVLVQVEGLSYREAARWLGVPLGTLQWRLWRAVCLLQAALRDLVGPAANGTGGRRRSLRGGRSRGERARAVSSCPGESEGG
jgi:RNA polymerase sigma-70 factor, ECF subfamily